MRRPSAGSSLRISGRSNSCCSNGRSSPRPKPTSSSSWRKASGRRRARPPSAKFPANGTWSRRMRGSAGVQPIREGNGPPFSCRPRRRRCRRGSSTPAVLRGWIRGGAPGWERSPATTAISLCRPPAQANWGSAGAISSPSAPREAPIFAVSSYPGNGSSPSGHRGRALGCSVRTNPCRAPPRRMSEPATTPESTKLTNVACARPGTGFPSSTRLTSS